MPTPDQLRRAAELLEGYAKEWKTLARNATDLGYAQRITETKVAEHIALARALREGADAVR